MASQDRPTRKPHNAGRLRGNPIWDGFARWGNMKLTRACVVVVAPTASVCCRIEAGHQREAARDGGIV